MPKTFYTEHDIEDLAARGVTALDVNDDIVLTDLAREKALNLGVKLVRNAQAASPSRPGSASMSKDEVVSKVKAAVIARLGDGVDPTLLETVITRVVAQVK